LLVISIKLKKKDFFNVPIFYLAFIEYNFIKILHTFQRYIYHTSIL
jgi:hypothetical protein